LREPAPAPSIAATPPASTTPAPVLVRLVVVHPGARTVQAAGDFNGWNPQATPLEPVSNGAWTVTIPLEPGRYEYQFVVDGEQWMADPFAVEQSDDGFGSRNAVLDVRPAGAAL
jgi:1,4-alpha-glucan branching enzyme